MTTRRQFIAAAGAAGLCLALPGRAARAAGPGTFIKSIPSTGENIPAVGMGSWLTFDVASDRAAVQRRVDLLRTFFAAGGGMVVSSPMYARRKTSSARF
ncbi:MAG: twin-arginine translocation signal domain-containing protein [Rhodospirillaceae bacterium]